LIARFDGAFSAQMVRHADITQHRDRPQARLWPTRRRASLPRKAIVSGILAPAAPGLTLFALMVARYLGFTLAMQRAKAAGAPRRHRAGPGHLFRRPRLRAQAWRQFIVERARKNHTLGMICASALRAAIGPCRTRRHTRAGRSRASGPL